MGDFFDDLIANDVAALSVDTGSDTAVDASTSDYLRSGAVATGVDWGTGAQDGLLGAEVVSPDSNSTSDRLRDIVALEAGGATREEAFTQAVGGQPYDPELSTGTTDWIKIFDTVAKGVNVLGGAVRTVGNGYNLLAGIRSGAGGTPAKGGTPAPSWWQRLLGPRVGTGVGSPTQTDTAGTLLMVGAVVGIGYLLFVHKRR